MRTLLAGIVPSVCAIFIALLVSVLRPAGVSDFTFGAATGVPIGISLASLLVWRHRRR